MTRSGIALVICAPSGTGKTTLIKRLLAHYSNFSFSISCTTRDKRPGETQGVDYDFLPADEFKKRCEQGYFAEWAEVHGNYYGTPLKATRDALAHGKDVLFDIDVQGARQLRTTIPEAHFVFILPPSRKELEKRLQGRGTETPESLARRIAAAGREIIEARWFNYCIVNDDLERAWEELQAVYTAATLAPDCQSERLTLLLQEWDTGANI